MAEYLSKEAAVDSSYLSDWYISSVGNESPIWTDEHIDELLNDFIVIPKATPIAGLQPAMHGRWEGEYSDDDVWCAECTNCKKEAHSRFYKVSTYAFCPNCGAIMDGTIDEKVAEQDLNTSKPDGNCLDCKFQYLEGSDYWCSMCPGNPEDI